MARENSDEMPGKPCNGYKTQLSYEIEDPTWDAFLASTPGGLHVQTSLWAQLKALQDWQSMRLIVTREGEIVAGAQLLLLSLGMIGAIGYVNKAPLFAIDDPCLQDLVVNQLRELARTQRIQLLIVQPPSDGQAIARKLVHFGFLPSLLDVGPTATTVIDLNSDLDDILTKMKRGTRYNMSLGQRKGITVWEGTEDDLSKYYEILLQTSERQGFTPYPEDYYIKMWRVLRPHGFIRLFLAGLNNEIVSAQLAVAFGDTVINKLSVWSGKYGDCRPNEVLQWSAIKWAKANGYRHYDFEGINSEAAEALLKGESIPSSLKQSVTSFKLGFGGEAVLMPDAYDYLYHPFIRWSYNNVLYKIVRQSFVRKTIDRIRTR